MASSIAAMTMPRSIAFSRATASAICSDSSLLALTAIVSLLLRSRGRPAAVWVLAGALVASAVLGLFGGIGLVAVAACFAQELLPAQRFGDQLVGENELGFADVVHRQQRVGGIIRCAVDSNLHRVAFNAVDGAAEAL